MKRFCLFLFGAINIIAAQSVRAQAPYSDTLRVVNWNIEYFGDPSYHTPSVQTTGVRAMMNAINADIYAICEVVNIDSLASVVNSLPGSYGYLVAQFGSLAPSPASPNYASAQKLAIVYNRAVVRNVSGRAFMGSSSDAYNEFSSGRYPFFVSAEILGRDQEWQPINFFIIHAKAYADAKSCQRRTDGCKELKDSLDKYFATSAYLILGDFNDDLDTSICSNSSVSNYVDLVNDSTHYKAITLPISLKGAFSIDGYTSLIDHVIASDEMYPFYVQNSAEVLRPLAKSVDPKYNNDISDHFPVRTKYVVENLTQTSVGSMSLSQLKIFPNPVQHSLSISGIVQGQFHYEVADLAGKKILSGIISQDNRIDVSRLSSGNYFLRVITENGAKTVRHFIKAE